MKIEFAFIPGTSHRAIGVVVSVKPTILQSPIERERVRASLASVSDFRGLPIILAGSTGQRIQYHGDANLVRQLSRIDALALPWRTATLAA